MARFIQHNKTLEICGPGFLLVCSDLHGNLEDFRRMVELFESEEDAVLLFLGDLFHGPSVSERQWDRLYAHLADYYPDESADLYREISEVMARYPDRVASLLGNHDHAHVGGPMVSKFYLDEAAAMEKNLSNREIASLRQLLQTFPVLATSSCGVAFTHGAPPARPFTRQDLESISFDGYQNVSLMEIYHKDLLGELLWKRGSSLEETRSFLKHLRDADLPHDCNLVVHGHEIAPDGYDIKHDQVFNLSTSFGMKRVFKRYLCLDLSATYATALDLRDGEELLDLYPHLAVSEPDNPTLPEIKTRF